MSVCLSVHSAPTEQIFIKFDTALLFENLKKFRVSLKPGWIAAVRTVIGIGIDIDNVWLDFSPNKKCYKQNFCSQQIHTIYIQ
jgi:hypothetical protein